MSYPQQGGYQQQPWQQGGGQPGGGQGGYGGGGYNYPAQTGGGNPATAIIAGILGIAVAALLAIPAFKMLGDAPDNTPTELTIMVVLLLAAAAVCLVGSIVTFVRKVAGAFVLLIGAIVAIAAILLQPVLIGSAMKDAGAPDEAIPGMGDFLEAIFKFNTFEDSCLAIALILAPILLIFSVIPPTLNWLRGATQSYGGYQQPQQGGYQSW
ncbi:hypothetical protein [Labedaea rhizosphaerae]|uniref:Uncharacterized protein n=1 Tax=Labedaea rhizosphaerae TaxID=598644 RepID=A0A4V3D037_LABRH|nr:hypothetical protein [Labedaea rhizosphaerae]TDQ04215.1 hypothetical protein EV186_101157 [Labedaea rhizosphaerae]